MSFAQVKHSKTSSVSSYERDFRELISIYSNKGSDQLKSVTNLQDEIFSGAISNWANVNISDGDISSSSDSDKEDTQHAFNGGKFRSVKLKLPRVKKLSVEYQEDEGDFLQQVDDWDGNILIL